jgi:hypothetical protein
MLNLGEEGRIASRNRLIRQRAKFEMMLGCLRHSEIPAELNGELEKNK